MIIRIFQGTDIEQLKNEIEAETAKIPLKASHVLQSQSSIPNPWATPEKPDITIVTITVYYE
jgi:hypothetical protein